jgi:hypothetical protein
VWAGSRWIGYAATVEQAEAIMEHARARANAFREQQRQEYREAAERHFAETGRHVGPARQRPPEHARRCRRPGEVGVEDPRASGVSREEERVAERRPSSLDKERRPKLRPRSERVSTLVDPRLAQPCDAEGGNRTHTARRPPDFESGASASSATSAWSQDRRGPRATSTSCIHESQG